MVKRTAHQASFKGKVALAALKETKTLAELSQEFKLYPALIATLKTQAIQNIAQLFDWTFDKQTAGIVTDRSIGCLNSMTDRLKPVD